jgi:SRSO17 transposase
MKIEEEDLSTYLSVTIEEDANGDPFITVIDDNAECKKGKKLVYYYNEVAPELKTPEF